MPVNQAQSIAGFFGAAVGSIAHGWEQPLFRSAEKGPQGKRAGDTVVGL